MNETIRLINDRVSLRRYDKRIIEDNMLDEIINAAMRAPTAGNMMMYSIIVIKDEDTKKTLSETCDHQPFIATAPVVLMFFADYEKWDQYFRMHEMIGYQGPTEADLMLAISDTMIAAQNAVIAAESLGIGSCYIGDIMENYEVHKDLLGLPDRVFPIGMLTLGYYEENYNKVYRSRFKKEYVVFEEKYKKLSEDEILDMFRENAENFSKNKIIENPHRAFCEAFYNRKISSEFFKEMNRSLEVMRRNWHKHV